MKLLIVFSFLISVIHLRRVLKRNYNTQPPQKSILYSACDDMTTSIKINGNEILKKPSMGWLTTYRYEVGLLPGDHLSITEYNNDNRKIDRRGDAGIVATLHYRAPDGRTTVINTDDKKWTCNGEVAYSFGTMKRNPWNFHWKHNVFKIGNAILLETFPRYNTLFCISIYNILFRYINYFFSA